jgi:thymidylate synthase (FAD)
MKTYARNYQEALDDGIKPEDARYLLPEASKTAITMTVNVRELFHFFDMRLDKAAQWEIRELANQIKESLKNLGGEWQWLMELYEERS